jgi:NADH:ubiquinone oxidoreductase subunit 6 (subunit J)
MNIAEIIFYFFALLTVASAINILITKNVLHAAFSLLATFIGIAAIFVFAGADFLAMTQIMIYVGGILILLLFGIMLTNRIAGEQFIITGRRNTKLGIFISGILFIGLISFIVKVNFNSVGWIAASIRNNYLLKESTVSSLGTNLMTNFILPFEISALILMVALMGAALIAGKIKN